MTTVKSIFINLKSNVKLTPHERYVLNKIESHFSNKYQDEDLSTKKRLEIKNDIEKNLPRLKSENWEFKDPNHIYNKIQKEPNSVVLTISDNNKNFSVNKPHPGKVIGEITRDNKIYVIVKPLTTTNHQLEKILSGIKLKKPIPDNIITNIIEKNPELLNRLLDNNMIIETNGIYIRGPGSWCHGENGDQSLLEEYNLPNNKIQYSSKVYIICEKEKFNKFFYLSKNKFSKEQSHILMHNFVSKENHVVFNIEKGIYGPIFTAEVNLLSLMEEVLNSDKIEKE